MRSPPVQPYVALLELWRPSAPLVRRPRTYAFRWQLIACGAARCIRGPMAAPRLGRARCCVATLSTRRIGTCSMARSSAGASRTPATCSAGCCSSSRYIPFSRPRCIHWTWRPSGSTVPRHEARIAHRLLRPLLLLPRYIASAPDRVDHSRVPRSRSQGAGLRARHRLARAPSQRQARQRGTVLPARLAPLRPQRGRRVPAAAHRPPPAQGGPQPAAHRPAAAWRAPLAVAAAHRAAQADAPAAQRRAAAWRGVSGRASSAVADFQ